jgi:uncharacterized protein YdaU (DUF1376 family)
MHYWQTGGLPKADAPLSRIACMSSAEWRKAKPVVAPFFGDDWASHKRIDAELAKAAEISGKRRAAAEQRHNKSDANAELMDTHAGATSLSPSPIKKEKDIRAVAKATRPDNPVFEECFWKVYPKRKGANPKDPARKLFEGFVMSGVDPTRIKSALLAGSGFDRDKIGTEFIPQAVKWLRDRRWEDYPEAGIPTTESETDWDAALERYRKYSTWPVKYLGPEPGSVGCQVPREWLEKHGLSANSEAA